MSRAASLADAAAGMALLVASVPLAVLVAVRPDGVTGAAVPLMLQAQIIASAVMVMRRRAPLVAAGCAMLTAAGVVGVKLAVTQSAPLGPLLPIRSGEHPYHLLDPWVPAAIGIAVHAVARYGKRSQAVLTWLALGLVTLTATRPWQPSAWPGIPAGLLFTAAPALVGLYIATREKLVHALTGRAERAEREQRLRAEQARASERARLAAEMHDVVTHRVSLMVLQAGAWRIQASHPGCSQTAEALRSAGCEVLDELRDLLAVLRSEPGCVRSHGGIPGDVPLPDVMPLVDAARLAGSIVRFHCDGPTVTVSPAVSRAVYRIVQEALTNVRKHAPATDVDVHIQCTPDSVLICLRNSAPAAGGGGSVGPGSAGPGSVDTDLAGAGSGTGLLGLRERVVLVRGELTAGPAADGGFEVRARLPLRLPGTETKEA
ncbi:MAG TPA: histidine kinase [Streptosporangiaceae bacterium]